MVVGLGIASGLGLAYSVYAGETQAKAQRKGLRRQQQAEQEAENRALREVRIGEEEENRARQKSPNLDVLLADSMRLRPGPQSIDADRLLLGRPGTLG